MQPVNPVWMVQPWYVVSQQQRDDKGTHIILAAFTGYQFAEKWVKDNGLTLVTIIDPNGKEYRF